MVHLQPNSWRRRQANALVSCEWRCATALLSGPMAFQMHHAISGTKSTMIKITATAAVLAENSWMQMSAGRSPHRVGHFSEHMRAAAPGGNQVHKSFFPPSQCPVRAGKTAAGQQ